MSYIICEQQRFRSAYAFALSNQRLCYSLPRKYNISFAYIRHFKPLTSLCGYAGWLLPYLVANPESCLVARLIFKLVLFRLLVSARFVVSCFTNLPLGSREELRSLIVVTFVDLSQLMRLWYLSHRRPAKAHDVWK